MGEEEGEEKDVMCEMLVIGEVDWMDKWPMFDNVSGSPVY